MPKIQLSMTSDYVPNWDASDGVREIFQNAMDGQDEGYQMTVDWYNDTLRIENSGVVLPRESLLLGFSTKRGTNLRGQHGDGIKTGLLALVRAGMPVKIRNGSEVWEPKIEHSDQFNAKVLVINVQEGRKRENRIRVEIGGITKEMWANMKPRFLFLEPKDSVKQVKTDTGALLLDSKYAGKIFVKGIFVQTNSKLTYGYDLYNCNLDRDRKMVDSYDLNYSTNQIWVSALSKRPDLFTPFFELFQQQAGDIEGINQYNAGYIPEPVRNQLTGKFHERYGKNAVPVLNMEQSRELEHYGKQGVVVNKHLGALLQTTIGDFETVKKNLKSSVKETFGWHDLTEQEKTEYQWACDALKNVADQFDPSTVNVVALFDDKIEGLYSTTEGIKINRKFLGDRYKVLQILIHEYAHASTGAGDSEKNHVNQIEELWMKVFKNNR